MSHALPPRWRKLLGDVAAERGRVAAMIVAIAVSVVAVGAVLGAYAILTREIRASYLGTRPASATLEVPAGVDAALVARVREDPRVEDAEARAVVVARMRVGEDWRPLLLFVVDDFTAQRTNTFAPESGAWPPPPGTMLVERSAIGMMGAGEGGSLLVKTPHGLEQRVPISGVVHDPGLAPAWQERSGYAYVTRETVVHLGEPARLDELRVRLAGDPSSAADIEATVESIATQLGAAGVDVHQVRVPPPKMHPHQRQMTVILVMMLLFSALALVLSAVLVATSLSAMLARQTREIGVMKTLGATGSQIGSLYVVLVSLVGALASLVALPLGMAGARVFARAVSTMLNFEIVSLDEPAWVFVVQLVAGIAVPLLIAAIPVRRASTTSVRAALDRHGASADFARASLSRLPRALRSALRRPGRLVLTLTLLSAGGAMFMAALDVKQSWRAMLEKIPATRFYDVEVRLHEPASPALLTALRGLDGVEAVEAWGFAPAAFARPGRFDFVRTYPDRGHGSLNVMAPPADTRLVRYEVLDGRWLTAEDVTKRVVVLNHSALAQLRQRAPRVKLGDDIAVSVDGASVSATLIGVVEEIGAAGVAYTTPETVRATNAASEARMVRVAFARHALSGPERVAQVREIERVLAAQRAPVDVVMPLEELRTAMGDHIIILVNALSALAAVMAIVGILGLATTVSISVVERTREIGVMKTLGATPARVRRWIVEEALVVAAMGAVSAALLSMPLALLLDTVVGRLGFLAPLDFLIDPTGVVGWAVVMPTIAALAALVPASRAAALRPREALLALG